MPETLATERLVNTVTDGVQRPGDVAVATNTMAVWIDQSSGAGVAKLRMFGPDGTPLGGEVTVGAATDVAVTTTATGFAVVRIVQMGRQQVDVIGQTYRPDGQPSGGPVTLSTVDVRNTPILERSSREIEITSLSDGGYIVGWSNSSGDSNGRVSVSTEYAVVSAGGVIEGSGGLMSAGGRAVTGGDTALSFTELPGGKILATYAQLAGIFEGPTSTSQFAQILDSSGQRIGPAFRLDVPAAGDGGPSLNPSAGLAVATVAGGSQVAFAWTANGQVWVSLYKTDALLAGTTERTAPVSLGAVSGEPEIAALADGRFVVGFAANGDVVGQLFSATGAPEGSRFVINESLPGLQDELRLFLSPQGVLGALWQDAGGNGDPSATGVKLQISAFGLNQDGGPLADRLTGGPSIDVLSGLAGDDVLLGLGGSDVLLGGMGGDSLIGGAGDDRIDGGLNTDFVSYADATAAVTVDLTAGTARGGAGSDTLINIEAAYGSAFNDRLTGNYLSNLLVGDAGNDTLEGMSGSNYLDGGAGTDTLVLVGSVTDYFVTNVTASSARIIGPYGDDQALNFERVRIGGTEITWDQFTSQAFNGLRYVASNPDLIASIGTDVERARQHWMTTGRAEGRSLDSFDPLRYAASNPDLAAQFYIDTAALSRHFIQTGFAAGRSATSFDPLQYGAANADLLRAFGVDPAALTRHYAVAGVAENRPKTGFDPLAYGASNDDLARVFGTDTQGLFNHWINAGAYEGREPNGFDPVAYLLSYPDLVAAGVTVATAQNHWLSTGADQFLRGDELFGREQGTNHTLIGLAESELKNFTTSGRFSADRDWFEIRMPAGVRVTAEVQGLDTQAGTLADPRIQVYDSAGRLIGSDDDSGIGRNASFSFNSTGGAYYIVVSSASEGQGTYVVSASASAASGDGWIV